MHPEAWTSCEACSLHRTRCKLVYGSGPLSAKVLIVGEAPGPDEDEAGEPFIGPAGKILRRALKVAKLTDDCFITNTVACMPFDKLRGSFRKPTIPEMDACAPRLNEIHESLNPSIVVLVGNVALSLIGRNRITKNRGWHPRNKRFPGSFIYATVHPSYILRRGSNKEEIEDYTYDWKRVKNALEKLDANAT